MALQFPVRARSYQSYLLSRLYHAGKMSDIGLFRRAYAHEFGRKK
jgi:hypothetical protein